MHPDVGFLGEGSVAMCLLGNRCMSMIRLYEKLLISVYVWCASVLLGPPWSSSVLLGPPPDSAEFVCVSCVLLGFIDFIMVVSFRLVCVVRHSFRVTELELAAL